MKLSQAIRIGARSCPQAFLAWTRGYDGCALTAAMIGGGLITVAGLNDDSCVAIGMFQIDHKFPDLLKHALCPSCASPDVSVKDIIMHMNDLHRYTRERIAGWVEAHVEVPVYSMLEIQEFMGEPIEEPVYVNR